MRQVHDGRRLLTALAVVIGCVALLTGVPSRASAAALSGAAWTASKTTQNATGAAYTYLLVPQTGSSLSKITMTVPSGTTGTPAVGTVTPSAVIGGGTASLSGTLLTYTLAAPVTVPAGLALSITLTGLTNSAATGSQSTTITTYNGTAQVDTGTAAFTFTASTLSNVSLVPSSTMVSAANVGYTYGFTIGLALTTTQITLSVPPGTTGTPTIGSISPAGLVSGPSSISLSGTTLTINTLSIGISISQVFSIQVNGLTNTPTAGQYVPEVTVTGVVAGLLGVTYSNVGPAVTFPGGLWVGAPGSLSWSGRLNGQNQALADQNPPDQKLTVNDQTDSAAGWHVTVSATNFVTGGGYALPASGVLGVTGSTAALWTSVAPTAACQGSAPCTPADASTVTYPVIITSAASSPLAATVYSAKRGTGVGLMSLGGSVPPVNPVGWWVSVPGYAASGTYSSTVTVSVISGP